MLPPKSSKVAILGAGASGLTTAKALLDAGYEHLTLYEQSDDIGGVWTFRAGAGEGFGPPNACYNGLTTNSSRDMMRFSDFGYHRSAADFPHHRDVHRLLHSYCVAFRLLEAADLRTYTRVTRVAAGSTRAWTVVAADVGGDEEAEEYDGVVVCVGMFWHKRMPPILQSPSLPFKGKVLHSLTYRWANRYAGSPVCILGIGNSALDIATELLRLDEKQEVILCYRNGSLMIPLEEEEGKGSPLDQRILQLSPNKSYNLLIQKLTAAFVSFGMPPPPASLMQAHASVVKAPSVLLGALASGRLKLKPTITEVRERSVVHMDGSESTCGTIIACTGYVSSFPFLEKGLAPGVGEGGLSLYRRVLHPSRPSLAFVGQIDTIGSAFAVSEMQARWLAAHWSGAISLPDMTEMEEATRKAAEKARGNAFPLFENYVTYMTSMAREAGLPAPDSKKPASGSHWDGPLLPVRFAAPVARL